MADGWGFINPFAFYATGSSHRVVDTALHPPLYTSLLAIPARFGIDSMLSQRVMTSLLGAATVFLVGMLGRAIGGNRVGLITAGIAAVAPALWVNDSVLGLETLYCFLLVVALLALYSFWDRPRMTARGRPRRGPRPRVDADPKEPILFVLLALPTVLLKHGLAWRDRAKYLGVDGRGGCPPRRSVGGAQSHDLRRTHLPRHRVRARPRLRQLRPHLLR